MSKKYTTLRAIIRMRGITLEELSKRMGLSTVTLSRKFSGRTGFLMGEAAEILRILHIPYNKLPLLFPDGGIDTIEDKDVWALLGQ